MITDSGSPNFFVVSVSDPLNINVFGSMTLTGGPRDIVVNGNYAYVASTNNSQELQIVDVTNPASPSLAGTYNASGTANAFSVAVSGLTAFLAKDTSSSAEFFSINISNPSSPSLRDTLEFGSAMNGIAIVGNYAYISTDSNTQELAVVSIGNPADVTLAGSLNLPGTQNAETISGFGNTVVMGESGAGAITIVDITNPLTPLARGNYNAGGIVRDLALKDNDYVFVVGDYDSNEFQVIDITNPTAPNLFGSINTSDDLNGVVYDYVTDTVYAVGDSDTQEVLSIKPQ